MNFDINSIIRPNIRSLVPYSSARDEFEGDAHVFLDANENSMGSAAGGGCNRYPDPYQLELKRQVSRIKNVPVPNIFIGNGSDEPIDLLIRATCIPGESNIIICPPTYGMYEVSANINGVPLVKVPLTNGFQLNTGAILEAITENTRLIFICSPNNPTGNCMRHEDIQALLNGFNGLVVVDEAYIDFAGTDSWSQQLNTWPNLVVLQTLSKAWGLAALRVGLCFASEAVIAVLNKIKPPYNINLASQQMAAAALASGQQQVEQWLQILAAEKQRLEQELPGFSFVREIFPSNANFLLIRVSNAPALYHYLAGKGIVVRNRHGQPLCDNCLRITAGTPEENGLLLEALREFKDN
jgi:histidinol-phosphate aminotransferase